jgi:hypothetical protein
MAGRVFVTGESNALSERSESKGLSLEDTIFAPIGGTMASSSGCLGYIVRCSDNSLYVGHADDLDSREKTHNEGRGSRDTAQRRPVHRFAN